MFDCPPHIQTSPTRTLCNSTLSRPVIFTVYGPPAGGAGISTCQRRSAPATAEAVLTPISTRTLSPGSDQPQILSALLRCSTMLSPKIGLTNGSTVGNGTC